jgi:DNA-binding NarL/FixJ family response regulator
MIKVLLVDDHTLFRQGVRALLAAVPEFVVVGEAADGQEAIRLAEQTSPDVVVMDLLMPNMDGFEATRILHEKYPDLKILILSMYDDEDYVHEILRAGGCGYVLKRSASDDLIRAVQEVFSGGASLHPDVAAKLVQNYVRQDAAPASNSNSELTQREIEVLRLVAEGHTNQEIGKLLGISRKTVDAHRTNFMRKLDLHDVTELVKHALRQGLIKL